MRMLPYGRPHKPVYYIRNISIQPSTSNVLMMCICQIKNTDEHAKGMLHALKMIHIIQFYANLQVERSNRAPR